LGPHLPPQARHRPGWTRHASLPGGDFAVDGLAALAAALATEYAFLTPAHAGRLAAAYGTRARDILGGARTAADPGGWFGAECGPIDGPTQAGVMARRHFWSSRAWGLAGAT